MLDMSVEEAAKLVISAGLVAPKYKSEEPTNPNQPAMIGDENEARKLIETNRKSEPNR